MGIAAEPQFDSTRLASQVREIVEKQNPDADSLTIARLINGQKRELAEEVHASLPAEMRDKFPVDQLVEKLSIISEEPQAGQEVQEKVAKEGWIMRSLRGVGNVLTYPIRHPWETAKFALKAAVVGAVVAIIGSSIVSYFGGQGFAWLERLLQNVGLNRLADGVADASGALGRLGGGSNVVINPSVPNPVAGSGDISQLPGPDAGVQGSPGEYLEGFWRWTQESARNIYNMWGQNPGSVVPGGSTPGAGINQALPRGTSVPIE